MRHRMRNGNETERQEKKIKNKNVVRQRTKQNASETESTITDRNGLNGALR